MSVVPAWAGVIPTYHEHEVNVPGSPRVGGGDPNRGLAAIYPFK